MAKIDKDIQSFVFSFHLWQSKFRVMIIIRSYCDIKFHDIPSHTYDIRNFFIVAALAISYILVKFSAFVFLSDHVY